jgi:hypothetical protein
MALKQNIKTIFYSSFPALLSLVLVFNLSFNAFHIHTDEHHHSVTEKCSPDEENDACHRFLIHHEESAGCNGGHEHISNKPEDCFACHYFKNQELFLIPDQVCVFISNTIFGDRISKVSRSQSLFSEIVLLRGPPALS